MADEAPNDVEVRRNDTDHRYELLVDGELAGVADYRPSREPGVLVFPHTEVDPSRRGSGLGEVLVRRALDDVRARGERVVPACWFVAEFFDLNPDYAELRAP